MALMTCLLESPCKEVGGIMLLGEFKIEEKIWSEIMNYFS
jgi:hypothetical protein